MASSDIMEELQQIASSDVSQSDKIPAYTNVLMSTLKKNPSSEITSDLKGFIDFLLQDTIGIIISRPVLTELVASLDTYSEAGIKKDVSTYLLEALQPRIISFEEQDTNCRLILAAIYENEHDFEQAAKVLRGIQLESAQRIISNEFRFKIYVRIMRNLLEDNETVTAEDILNRATSLIHSSTDDTEKLHFFLCQARIFDAKREFLNACQKYLQLSVSSMVEEPDRIACLNAAIICAVLAPAGPARSRSLATLYKDDRVPTVEHFAILEKMYFDRLLSTEDVDAFAKKLQPHQTAPRADGTTVLTRAVIEHNLLAASRLYNNIGIIELGVLLNLSEDQAEEYAARMIEQKRLSGQIDQIDKLIYFDEPTASTNIIARQTRKWDANILGLAEEVEKVTTLLQNDYPVSCSE